jgi:hypothetical protein
VERAEQDECAGHPLEPAKAARDIERERERERERETERQRDREKERDRERIKWGLIEVRGGCTIPHASCH